MKHREKERGGKKNPDYKEKKSLMKIFYNILFWRFHVFPSCFPRLFPAQKTGSSRKKTEHILDKKHFLILSNGSVQKLALLSQKRVKRTDQ